MTQPSRERPNKYLPFGLSLSKPLMLQARISTSLS